MFSALTVRNDDRVHFMFPFIKFCMLVVHVCGTMSMLDSLRKFSALPQNEIVLQQSFSLPPLFKGRHNEDRLSLHSAMHSAICVRLT